MFKQSLRYGVNRLLPAVLLLASCSKSSERGMTAVASLIPPTAQDTTQKHYLALGDSYTIGEAVQPGDRFPAQTTAWLRSRGLVRLQDPEYIATTGWTTRDLAQAIQTKNPQGPYDIITLLIGVNDQYQHLDTCGYRIRFSHLLEKALSLAGNQHNRVFVLSIPDYSATPFGDGSAQISAEIAQFNTINFEVTALYQAVYVNITPISKQAANDPGLTAKDGLHPSAKQYALWAYALAPVILDHLP